MHDKIEPIGKFLTTLLLHDTFLKWNVVAYGQPPGPCFVVITALCALVNLGPQYMHELCCTVHYHYNNKK